MASYLNGRYESERPHSPYEASEVECRDCFSVIDDPDEEYCLRCSEPLCTECQKILADEPLCNRCFATLKKAALASLRNDPLVGDLFSAGVAA